MTEQQSGLPVVRIVQDHRNPHLWGMSCELHCDPPVTRALASYGVVMWAAEHARTEHDWRGVTFKVIGREWRPSRGKELVPA